MKREIKKMLFRQQKQARYELDFWRSQVKLFKDLGIWNEVKANLLKKIKRHETQTV